MNSANTKLNNIFPSYYKIKNKLQFTENMILRTLKKQMK